MSWYYFAGIVLVAIGSISGAFGGAFGAQFLAKNRKGKSKNITIGILLILISSFFVPWGFSIISNEPTRIAKKNITPYIEKRKQRIVNACQDIREKIYWASFYPEKTGVKKDHESNGIPLIIHGDKSVYPEEAFPEDEELNEMLKMIPSQSFIPARYIRDQGTVWIDYFDKKIKETTEAIQDIHEKSNLVESELIKDIAEIEDCAFFTKFFIHLDMQQRITASKLQNKQHMKKDFDLSLFHDELLQYFGLIQNFEKHYMDFSSNLSTRKYVRE